MVSSTRRYAETDDLPPARTPRPGLYSWLAGAIAAAVALGVGELVAAWVGPASSPLVAVGQGVIRIVPESLKRLAISLFGQADKLALVVGTVVLLLVLAAVIGQLARRSIQLGDVGIAALAVVGALAAATAPAGGPLAVLPSLVGGVAGAYALRVLVRAIPRRSASTDEPAAPSRGIDRRGFLTVASVTTVVAALGGGIGLVLRSRFDVSAARAKLVIPKPTSPAPARPAGADLAARPIRGLTPLITANPDFYRIDTALSVPQVDPQEWRLRIHGMVDRSVTLTLDELLKRDLIERDLTLACVSNEVGDSLNSTARFIGVPLGPLLDELGVASGADQIFTTSVDGFTASVQLAAVTDGRDAMLAVAMNGEPLPPEHGFPVRMVVPGLFGYVSATKWISDLELTTYDQHSAYWTQRGWSDKGPVKTFSRIDVPTDGIDRDPGSVVVAGIAYAMHRGIEKVELSIDDGPWRRATLSPEDNPDMWRQWYLDWDAPKGDHLLTVRATDGTGEVQTSDVVGPVPDGATGLHRVGVSIG